jgi:threonine aldolase
VQEEQIRMFFASDNWAGAHPAISAALAQYSGGFDPAYGSGNLDRKAEERFSEIFEHEVSVWFLPTGTAANSLALAAVNRIGGVAFAHPDAHIREDEGGAPEFLTSGVRVRPVTGPNGKIDPAALEASVEPFVPGAVNMGRAMAVSITQATEIGTVYTLDEIAAIAAIAGKFDLPLHMDGARFANAMVALGCSPADMTWRQGVNMVSFGGTKNGCWCAEALVFFDPAMARDMAALRKRSGQLFSKSRFVAAQFLAYFDNGLWLDLARKANTSAAALAAAIDSSATARLAFAPQANEVFAILKSVELSRLQEAGAHLYDWPEPAGMSLGIKADELLVRLVASFETGPEDIAAISRLLV